jgi:hypothetical protein
VVGIGFFEIFTRYMHTGFLVIPGPSILAIRVAMPEKHRYKEI